MSLERVDFTQFNPKPVVGVDEVGRGCLAGHVYAAAVCIDENQDYELYTDSKTLSAKRRELLSQHIFKNHRACIAFASVEEISRYNILKASLLAMKRAVEGLNLGQPGHLLVDGNQKVPNLIGWEQTTLVKGDLRAAPIAAASIVAKVARDQWMIEQAEEYPEYGFEKHKGYCTKDHKEAIAKHGPCKWHRPTFSGVKEYLSR